MWYLTWGCAERLLTLETITSTQHLGTEIQLFFKFRIADPFILSDYENIGPVTGKHAFDKIEQMVYTYCLLYRYIYTFFVFCFIRIYAKPTENHRSYLLRLLLKILTYSVNIRYDHFFGISKHCFGCVEPESYKSLNLFQLAIFKLTVLKFAINIYLFYC